MISKVFIAFCVSILVIVLAEGSFLETAVVPSNQAIQDSKCDACKAVMKEIIPIAESIESYVEIAVDFIKKNCPAVLPKDVCDKVDYVLKVILDDLKNHANAEKFCKDIDFC